MGLETATYLNGLTASWPLSGDLKSQGDDHLRLIKATLQATFPSASRAFYFASVELSAIAMVLDATDQNNIIGVDTTAGDVNVTLPAGLAASDKGWSCEIFRSNTSGLNGIMVAAASGNISSPYGSVATCRIESPIVPVRFIWAGSSWLVVRLGPLIGSSMNWDGATIPPGYRAADGTTYSSTTFAELNAALGTATLRDKRGRVEAGVDNGSVNRLTATYFGTASVSGAVGGGESKTLSAAEIPNLTSTQTGIAVTVTAGGTSLAGSSGFSALGASGSGGFQSVQYNSSSLVNITQMTGSINVSAVSQGTGGTSPAHRTVQPTIITNKLVRVA